MLPSVLAACLLVAPISSQDQSPSDPIAQLQEKVQTDPNDLTARLQLADLCRKTNQPAPLLTQLLWLVVNQPESDQVLNLLRQSAGSFTTPEASALAKSSWESALASANATATTDYAAGLAYQSTDANRALQLFTAAHESYPANAYFADAEAEIYRKSIQPDAQDLKHIQPLSPQQASALKASLETSSDATIVGLVGEHLARQIRPPQFCSDPCTAANDALKGAAFQLLQEAANLQPDNARWQHDLTSTQHIASGITSPNSTPVPGAQRIGGKVMEANLIKKVEPVYPALAHSAGIQGTVEFAATIDETGHVVNLQLVRGHPLLVSAARDAVLQWAYRPTLLNGQPVTVITNVTVNFTLGNAPDSAPPKQ